MFVNMTFRYQGTFDWEKIMKGGRKFFFDKIDELDFTEKKYKDKVKSIEVVWNIKQNYDLYNQLVYDVDIKADPVKRVEVERDGKKVLLWDGKLRVWIKAGTDENYTVGSIAGKTQIFGDADSWIHKVYKKVTSRDRSDGTEDLAAMIAEDFLEFLKSTCNMDTVKT